MPRPLRILYSAGPGDVISTYRYWVKGEDDPSQLSMTYSGMFYELCQQGGHRAYVISSNTRDDAINDGAFRIVNRSTPFAQGPGPLFYVGQEWAALRLIVSALWFKADVAVVACGTASWISLRLMPLLGIPVVPSLHCMIWPPYREQTRLQRLVRRCRSPFFRKSATRVLSASEEITTQLKTLTRNTARPVTQFLPSYRRQHFDALNAPSGNHQDHFRVLFAGRIETNKGVFDLLEIAKRFDRSGDRAIEFDLCGAGSAMEQLKAAAASAGVADRFRCHGHCERATMRKFFENAHVVVVPTTGDFVEGFNQVVAEAVLAGRPVITSNVCPALNYVREATVQVAVDDVQGYGDAILKLQRDETFYEIKRSGCASAQEQFYDTNQSWMTAVQRTLESLDLHKHSKLAAVSAA